jgi:hypothetical protein
VPIYADKSEYAVQVWQRFLRLWNLVRQVLAVRGLLDWIGWWKPVVGAIPAIATAAFAIARHAPSLVVGISGPVVFVSVLFVWRAVALWKTVLIDQIPFDYLPSGSPLDHGWKLVDEEQVGTMPTIAALRDAKVSTRTIMAVKDHGWYALDYPLPYASIYDRVRFTARFADGGVLYLKFRIWTQEGRTRITWLAQLPVGGTIPHGDGSIEWSISDPTKILANGWILFDLSLPDQMKRTFAPSKFQLLGVRIRGSFDLSCIELFGPKKHAI